jgi:hypothetical protein
MRDHHSFDGQTLLANAAAPRDRGEDADSPASAGPAAEGGYRVTVALPYATRSNAAPRNPRRPTQRRHDDPAALPN